MFHSATFFVCLVFCAYLFSLKNFKYHKDGEGSRMVIMQGGEEYTNLNHDIIASLNNYQCMNSPISSLL